jgi:hypothetical protein
MKKRALRLTLSAALLVLAVSLPQRGSADAGVGAGTSFGQGRASLSVFGGSGSAFSQTYFVLGVGANYYVVQGLGLGLNFESWLGNTPGIYKLTPNVQYVFTLIPSVQPYVGVFYRRVFVDDLSDLNSVGTRVGAYLPIGPNTHFGLGGVYEKYLDCNQSSYHSCDDFYPEISFTVSF